MVCLSARPTRILGRRNHLSANSALRRCALFAAARRSTPTIFCNSLISGSFLAKTCGELRLGSRLSKHM